MIDLRSDTVTLPSKEMKEFMFNAPLGDDVFGEDPSINALQKKASLLFEKEKALFVPSGTMANLVSVLTHCNRGDEILLGNKSHIFKYEAGGTSVFGGIHSHQLNNNDDGTINIDDIKQNIRDTRDDHFPKYRCSSCFIFKNMRFISQ
jgi:threonine aldolase